MPPRSFLVFATTLIALLHLYTGWRLLPDLPIPQIWKLLCAGWLLASCALVPLGLLARGIKRQPLADRLAWIGLMALGFFSSLLVLTLFRDVLLLAVHVFARLGTSAPDFPAFMARSAAAVRRW